MNFLESVIIVILSYLCVYTLVDRICKAVEHCATAKSFSSTMAGAANNKKEE